MMLNLEHLTVAHLLVLAAGLAMFIVGIAGIVEDILQRRRKEG